MDTNARRIHLVQRRFLCLTGAAVPVVTASPTGEGTVRRTYRAGTIPGTYAVDIRTGSASMTVSIVAGNVTEYVVIPVY